MIFYFVITVLVIKIHAPVQMIKVTLQFDVLNLIIRFHLLIAIQVSTMLVTDFNSGSLFMLVVSFQ